MADVLSDVRAVGCTCQATILWVDDQPDEVGLLRFLSLEGFGVTAATTGTAALALASAHKYDAVVVDLHLPDLHGFTVIERLRDKGISCPVIAVTGYYLDPETPEHAYAVGVTAFLYKPLWFEDTVESLRVVVRSQAPVRTALKRALLESATQPSGQSPHDEAHRGDAVIARLLAGLDHLASIAHAESEERSRELLLGVLLSALADPALPLVGVRGCAQAVHLALGSPSPDPKEATTGARGLVRQAMGRPLTARHPIVRKALAVLLSKPRWWDEEELAKEVAASRSHFARIVHHDTGFEYRTLRRLVLMKAGMIDVLTSDEQFAQIAHRLGMSPGRFDEVFGETFGRCPREFRRLWSQLGADAEIPCFAGEPATA